MFDLSLPLVCAGCLSSALQALERYLKEFTLSLGSSEPLSSLHSQGGACCALCVPLLSARLLDTDLPVSLMEIMRGPLEIIPVNVFSSPTFPGCSLPAFELFVQLKEVARIQRKPAWTWKP